MTADQRFTLIMTAIGIGFTVFSAIMAATWKTVRNYLRSQITMQNKLQEVAEDTYNVVTNLDRHIQWHLDKGR